MKSEKGSQLGGMMMLVVLVTMLCVPIGIGYYTHSNAPAPTLHADASAK